MTVFEMAKQYYPKLWDKARLRQLVAAGRITQAEHDAILAPEQA